MYVYVYMFIKSTWGIHCRDLGLAICIHSLSGGLGQTAIEERVSERKTRGEGGEGDNCGYLHVQ